MIKIIFKKIHLWPIYLKSIVIVAPIFFIFTLSYLFYFHAKFEVRKNHYLTLLALKQKLKEQLKKTIDSQYQQKIENIKNKFGIYENDELNKFFYRTFSVLSNIGFVRINFLNIKNENFLMSLQVESNFVNTTNISKLLNTIARFDRFILVENFRWNFLNDLTEFKKPYIFILFKIYNFNLNQKRLILFLSKLIKNSKYTLNKSLIKFSLSKIKMIGFYSYNKIKNFGFVCLPNKKIAMVQLGDQLGLERGLVIGIYAEKILVLNKNLDKIIKLSIESEKLTYVKNFL